MSTQPHNPFFRNFETKKNSYREREREREREMASTDANQQQTDISALPIEQLNMVRKQLEEVRFFFFENR